MITQPINGDVQYLFKDYQLELTKADDRSKKIKFDCSTVPAEVTLNMPAESGTVLTDNSTLNASGLKTQGTTVDVSGSSSAQADQVLVATSAAAASWKKLQVGQLDKVSLGTLADNEVLVYEQSTDSWKNKAVPLPAVVNSYVERVTSSAFQTTLAAPWSFGTSNVDYNNDMTDSAHFKAPVTGKYYLEVRANLRLPAPTDVSINFRDGANNLITWKRCNPNPLAPSGATFVQETLSTVAYLNQNATVQVDSTEGLIIEQDAMFKATLIQ